MTQTAEVKVEQLLARIRAEGDRAIVDRVHPSFATHSQATLRWSTTDPPLAQLPNHLAHVLKPDEGWSWFMYDWDSLHLWLTAAYAQDTALLRALRAGDDLHTLNACDLFRLPYPANRANPHTSNEDAAWREAHHWQGKEDARRTVAKRFIYRVLKGGDYRKPPDTIPLSIFGGSAKGFVAAAQAWAYAHAPIIAWQDRIRAQARETGEVRTYTGKRRRLSERTAHAERAAIDFLCQGTEAEILNETILETVAHFGGSVRFKFQRHDFICWAVHASIWTEEVRCQLAALAQRELTIGPVTIRLKASFYVREPGEDEKRRWEVPVSAILPPA